MYHSLKSARKRQRRILKMLNWMLLACFLSATVWLWQDSTGGNPVQEVPFAEFAPVHGLSAVRQEVYTQVLPAKTVYCPDQSLPVGMERVISPGQDGQLRCTAEVEYRNGREISRTLLNQELICESEDRIVARGEQQHAEITVRPGSILLPDGRALPFTRTLRISAGAFPRQEGIDSFTLGDGTSLHIGAAAANPDAIPPGTRLFILTEDGGAYGLVQTVASPRRIAGLELYFPTPAECLAFGEQTVTAYFLGKN